MPLEPENEYLKNTVEASPLFEGRYASPRMVNWDPVANVRTGNFSLVFKAHDIVRDASVALKFYDISKAKLLQAYRLQAFE